MSDKNSGRSCDQFDRYMACGKNIYETEISAKVSKLVINVWQSSSKM